MNRKKGFTLTELLATIVILSIIMAVAVPSVIFIASKLKGNMFCTKISIIENDAKLWGQDHMEDLQVLSDGETFEDVSLGTSIITLKDLIDLGYIKEDDLENGSVLDPRNNDPLDDIEIIVYVKNKRVYAKIPSAIEDCRKDD